MTGAVKRSAGFAGNVAILGGGNIGRAIARGLTGPGKMKPARIHLTRRQVSFLEKFKKRGFVIGADNAAAVAACRTVLLTVQPGQLVELLTSIRGSLRPRSHLVLSAVAGVTINDIAEQLGVAVPIIRIMPNTAVAIGESMTCLAANGRQGKALQSAIRLFNKVGRTLVIDEELMTPATALCACGVAFFLRTIRAASQGGIQIGFHADDALHMAAQTARGAASLLLEPDRHPESEIDKVTTPRGCTIAGLNRMEHEGLSSAIIKGLVTATQIADSLFSSSGKPLSPSGAPSSPGRSPRQARFFEEP